MRHCHGIQGEGVVGFNENPLYGNKRLPELIQVIDETMPEDKPKTCRGDDAVAVGRYIFETFYTPEARASQKPPRIELGGSQTDSMFKLFVISSGIF